jgi:hypothetical protein
MPAAASEARPLCPSLPSSTHFSVFSCLLPAWQVTTGSQRFLSELGRHNYVTPTSYLELLSAFKSLLEVKRGDNTKARKRYTVGLEKLQGSADQVGCASARCFMSQLHTPLGISAAGLVSNALPSEVITACLNWCCCVPPPLGLHATGGQHAGGVAGHAAAAGVHRG